MICVGVGANLFVALALELETATSMKHLRLTYSPSITSSLVFRTLLLQSNNIEAFTYFILLLLSKGCLVQIQATTKT